MTLNFFKAIAALVIFLVSLLVAIYPLRTKSLLKQTESFSFGEALASGIFLGAAAFHMLPDAISTFAAHYGPGAYLIPGTACLMGLLLLMLLEKLSSANAAKNFSKTIPYFLTLILCVHALVEGMALGIGNTFSEATLILIALLAHKGSESFALSVMLLKHRLALKIILLIILFFSFMTPLGISFGTFLNQFTLPHHSSEIAAALFNAFAAGTFFYIATLHPIHFHKAASHGFLEIVCLILGVATMGVIAIWA